MYISIRVCVCMYIYICVCVCVCMYAFVHTNLWYNGYLCRKWIEQSVFKSKIRLFAFHSVNKHRKKSMNCV